MSTTKKLLLICNASSCDDIVNSMNRRLFKSGIPKDNYLSELGFVQATNLSKSNTLKDFIKKSSNTGNTLKVYSSITARSIETALMSLSGILGSSTKIEFLKYIEDKADGIEASKLEQRNNDILEHIKKRNSSIKSNYINMSSNVKKDLSKYKILNTSRVKSDIEGMSTTHIIIYGGRNFIYNLIRKYDYRFNNIIENTSIYELDITTKVINKKFPTVDDKQGYKKEEKYYFYKFKDMYLPLKDAGDKLPYISVDMASSCLGSSVLKRIIANNPPKKNNKVSKKNVSNSSNRINNANTYENLLKLLTN